MIICLGATPALQKTMTFDVVTLDAVNRAQSVRQYASGKSINAARVLHTLGRSPLATGIIGGATGALIAQDLNSIHLPHDFITVDAPTRACVTVVDRAAGTATELIEESASVPPSAFDALLGKLAHLINGAAALVLSGTLPPGAPTDFYARCVEATAEKNIATIIDAKGEPLRLALSMKPTVVKPNRGELEETVGMKIDTDDLMKQAIQRLIEAGPQWAVVTAGSGVTIASDGKSFWQIATPRVPVISPIGSGDSFAAGLAAGIAAGQSIPDACRLAVACGAANAMTALAGHLRQEDVDLVMPQISIQRF